MKGRDLINYTRTVRTFGQTKALALSARNRGDVVAARSWAKEARDAWQEMLPVLKLGGALS
jgi:predicted phosphatase